MADGRTDFPLPVGERLRQARLARRMSLDEVAARTRVPTRHLEAIERGDWNDLPAPTYSVGFAKAYADVVGLDRQEVGDELRAELGGGRAPAAVETFQPADPARVPPRTLATVAALVAAVGLAAYGYQRTAALDEVEPRIFDDAPLAETGPARTDPAAPRRPAGAPAAASVAGPVVLTATEDVWIQVSERGGRTLRSSTLSAGQSFEVPADAADPVLRTGRADLLRVTVGGRVAPPVGPANRLVKDVSLAPAALLGGTPASAAAPASTPAQP